MSKTILIVDDSESIREVVSFTLKNDGYNVEMARNGILALDKIRSKDYDLVISDIVMPEMDGYELCRKIKEDDDLKGIPVLKGKAFRRDTGGWNGVLYKTGRSSYQTCEITAVPYFMWANRDDGEMIVWIRQAEQ